MHFENNLNFSVDLNGSFLVNSAKSVLGCTSDWRTVESAAEVETAQSRVT